MDTETNGPGAPIALHGRRLWLVLVALLLGTLLAALDQTIVATASPTIVGDIGGSFGTAVFGSLFSSHLTANIAHIWAP